MAGRSADLILVLGPMNIDEAVAGIGVVVVHAIEPHNPGHNEVVGRWERVLRAEGYSAAKDSAVRHVSPDLLGNSKVAGRSFETAFLGSNPEPRTRNRICPYGFAILGQSELLVANRDIYLSLLALPRRRRFLRRGCAFI